MTATSNHWTKKHKTMKKIVFLLATCLFLLANCKISETESDCDSEYKNILNKISLSAEEKCGKITELFIKKHNIKTALSISVKNEKINFYKNYGLSSIGSKSICDSETLHYIYSITKTFTSALTLTLCEENILSLEETIEYHLPELFTENYAGTKDLNLYMNKETTIKQLLNHTSGIYDFAKNSKFYNTSKRLSTQTNLFTFITLLFTTVHYCSLINKH